MSETLIGSSDQSHAEYCDETMSETDNVYDLLQEVDQMSRRSCGPCTMHGYSRLATFCCRQCQYNYCSGCGQQHAKLVGHILERIETQSEPPYSSLIYERDSESTTVDKQSKRTSKGYHGDMIETDFDYEYECVTQRDSESTTVDNQSKRTSKDVIETDFDCDYECVTQPDSECTTVDRQTQRTATGYHSNVKEDGCDYECVTNEQTRFDVVVQETRAAKKWDVQGPHVLLVEAEGVSLLDVKSRDTLCTWLYPYIRRYGIKPSATCICLDFGQISATGQGVWEFKTPKYTAIHEQIKRSIVKYQGKLRYLEVKALYG